MMLDTPALKVFRAVSGGAHTLAQVRVATGLSQSVVVTRLNKLRAEKLVEKAPGTRGTFHSLVVEEPL